tara:strand:+ start:951 stop:1532 length:582 start_codon:yes stop_codon:yes gene_type:complete
MANGTYDNPRAGTNGSKNRMQKLTDKIKAGKQHRAEKRTRKSELISEHGRKTGKDLFKVEYASDRQKQKAQKRTKASEEMSAKGIEMNRRGYAKRRQVEKSDRRDTITGDYKKTKTIYDKSGNIKRTKTVTQITPVQQLGVGSGNYIAKVEKTGKEDKYKTKNVNPGSKAVRNITGAAVGILGINTLRSYLKR